MKGRKVVCILSIVCKKSIWASSSQLIVNNNNVREFFIKLRDHDIKFIIILLSVIFIPALVDNDPTELYGSMDTVKCSFVITLEH